MKNIISLFVVLLMVQLLTAQTTDPKDTEVWDPEPRIVTPGKVNAAPSDAIVIFDGTNLDAFTDLSGNPASWTITDGAMTVKPGTGDIQTRQYFGDIQLHLEWRSPVVVESEGQGRGNSGVFLQSRYEVQILDSYKNRTYSNGQAGAIYKQHMPLVNVSVKPGEWEVYDIIFRAPRFNKDGIKIASAHVTVIHNGVVIQNHVEILGTTEYIGMPKNEAHGKAPFKLQDHSNLVSYRNIWVREL